MAARKKAKADPSVTRRKSLDFLAAADNDFNDDDDRRRDMVARRLSYQHKSGTGYAQEFLHCFSRGFQKVPPFFAKRLKIKSSTFSTGNDWKCTSVNFLFVSRI